MKPYRSKITLLMDRTTWVIEDIEHPVEAGDVVIVPRAGGSILLAC